MFSPPDTADEAAIGNDGTRSESDKEQEPIDDSDAEPNDQHNSINNTAIMPATTISANAFDANLQDILSRVLELDLNSTPPHGIVEGLTYYGCFTWKALRCMGSTDIAGLSKKSGQTRVPLMGYSLWQLAKFNEFYKYNVDNNVTDHVLAAIFTLANFVEFVDKHRNAPLPPSGSASTPSHSNAKSLDEQQLQDWIRGKRSEDDFEILKEDKHHDKWIVLLEADIVVQGLQNHTDLKFNPATIPAGFA